jgi:hypothetical protein
MVLGAMILLLLGACSAVLGENPESHDDVVVSTSPGVFNGSRREGKIIVRHSHEEQTDVPETVVTQYSSAWNVVPTYEFPTSDDLNSFIAQLGLVLNPPDFKPIRAPMIGKIGTGLGVAYDNFRFGEAIDVAFDISDGLVRARLETPLCTVRRYEVRVTPLGKVTITHVPLTQDRPLHPGSDLWYYQDIDRTIQYTLPDGTPIPEGVLQQMWGEAWDACKALFRAERQRQEELLKKIRADHASPPHPEKPGTSRRHPITE